MNFKIVVSFFISYLITQASFCAAELKDATLRDEDISNTDISVEVTTRPDGLFEYVYTLESSNVNKGKIDLFQINLFCENSFEPIALPDSSNKAGYLGEPPKSAGAHTPTSIQADYGSSAAYGITINHNVM